MGAHEEIVRLVFAREQARLGKDWALADQLRERLAAEGVTLFDKKHEWKTADGTIGRIPTFTDLEAGATADYPVHEEHIPVQRDSEEEAHIRLLVQQREQARAGKDFARSDQLRDELKTMGVELLDKDKIWRSSSGLSGCIIGYRTAGASDKEINALLQQREKARHSSDYDKADMIRQELKGFGVDIYDRDKIWKASDGRSGPVPSWNEVLGTPAPVAPAWSPAAPARGGSVQEQLLQAAMAAASNPALAAKTLQAIQQATGAVPTGPRRSAAPAAPMSALRNANHEVAGALDIIAKWQNSGREPSDAEVNWLVELREKCRANKDFASADQLRNSLRQSLSIELNEKEKRWYSPDGRRHGVIPMWKGLVPV